jgi:hypothetical protein
MTSQNIQQFESCFQTAFESEIKRGIEFLVIEKPSARRPVDGDAQRALARPLDGGRCAAAHGLLMVTCRTSADGDRRRSAQTAGGW